MWVVSVQILVVGFVLAQAECIRAGQNMVSVNAMKKR